MKKQSVFLNYIIRNKKNFLIITGLFLVGIVLGIIFINNANSNQIEETKAYVSDLVKNIKSYDKINKTELLMQSVTQNILIILIIWFLGCTIVGSIFIFVAIIYRGFSLGYTISAIIACLGIKKGTVFAISALLLQNLVFLPAFFLLAESRNKII